MDKRFFVSTIIVLTLAIIAILAYNNLEIYQEKRYIFPSREANRNIYLAMERWLNESGHPVRIENDFNLQKLAAASERVTIIYTTACGWENAEEYIIPWIEQGNSLVICVNYSFYENDMDENFLAFLSRFGISIEKTSYSGDYRGENIPDFNWTTHFNINDNTDIITINDNEGLVRMAEISLGKGTLTVIGGFPAFMYNYLLEREINARLAWNLTGARATGENPGVLFVRTYIQNKSASLFGKIFERGNLIPVMISTFIAVFLGFWIVIPVFGLIFNEKPKNSRPIRERFLAETGFLKKYDALNYYLEIYNRELHNNKNENMEENYNYREIINKLRSVSDGTEKSKR